MEPRSRWPALTREVWQQSLALAVAFVVLVFVLRELDWPPTDAAHLAYAVLLTILGSAGLWILLTRFWFFVKPDNLEIPAAAQAASIRVPVLSEAPFFITQLSIAALCALLLPEHGGEETSRGSLGIFLVAAIAGCVWMLIRHAPPALRPALTIGPVGLHFANGRSSFAAEWDEVLAVEKHDHSVGPALFLVLAMIEIQVRDGSAARVHSLRATSIRPDAYEVLRLLQRLYEDPAQRGRLFADRSEGEQSPAVD